VIFADDGGWPITVMTVAFIAFVAFAMWLMSR
jgi:hypothetical protein